MPEAEKARGEEKEESKTNSLLPRQGKGTSQHSGEVPKPEILRWRYLSRIISSAKFLWTVALSVATLLGGYAVFRPNVSVDPDLLLTPGDPFSTPVWRYESKLHCFCDGF